MQVSIHAGNFSNWDPAKNFGKAHLSKIFFQGWFHLVFDRGWDVGSMLIPYNGKFSWDKIFLDLSKIRCEPY